MDFLPGELSRVRVRLLPWRPRWRTARDGEVPDVSGLFDFLDDPVSAVIGLVLAVLVLPFVLLFVLGVVVFSAELVLLLALVPFLMIGQFVGLLPWVLVLTRFTGERTYVQMSGTRAMLAARRRYRSLRL